MGLEYERSYSMQDEEKIAEIIKFVIEHPESTASRAILRRYYLNTDKYETGNELGIELKEVLTNKNQDEIDLCYYLVK